MFKNFPLRGLNKFRNPVRKKFIYLKEFPAARLKWVKKSYKKKAYVLKKFPAARPNIRELV